jgi:hypothetical protein
MNTIFWLSVVFGCLSFGVIVLMIIEYSNLSEFQKLYIEVPFWPVPTFIACVVTALTI